MYLVIKKSGFSIMSRRRRKKLPEQAIELKIEKLSHEGRGIAHKEGKTLFVEGALPGEEVLAVYTEIRKTYDELKTVEVQLRSPFRVTSPCQHANMCGGCCLQHINSQYQIEFKQQILREQFEHFAGLLPEKTLRPLQDKTLGYRYKARLGVRYVAKRDEVLVGFREKRSHFITDIYHCEVLHPAVGHLIPELRLLIRSLSAYREIPQIEVAISENIEKRMIVAMVFRHLIPLKISDREKLLAFGEKHQVDCYLQPKGIDTVHKIFPANTLERLTYELVDFNLQMLFHPMDFTQVNPAINRKMINQAMLLLEPQKGDQILDLFCGLGNFTLPLASTGANVTGIEGDAAMVQRGKENAAHNKLTNVNFFAKDLNSDFAQQPWASQGFNKILIDPPRSGALEIIRYIPTFKANRIVYVSCNPATLARDIGELVQQGYRLVKAGVMDMFPHTAHVESIALLEKA